MSFGERLKNARKEKKLTQKELGDKIGALHNSISNWENDLNKPDMEMLDLLCRELNVSPSFLITGNHDINTIENLYPIRTKKIPILGDIACGEPIFCNTDYESYALSDSDIHADFALKAKGDSMINARIYDGDIVFIRSQPEVENGEIAAVCIDNEATLKRVYISDNIVTLISENPRYQPITYNLSENPNIRILGKAVAFQSTL